MQKLINALFICEKYNGNTHCEHDALMLVMEEDISSSDKELLKKYTFEYKGEWDAYVSYWYGSC